MKKLALVTVSTIASLSAIAIAADTTIRQKGRLFSLEAVSIKIGDTLMFVNDDNVPHNIMSMSTDNEFNLGSQAPGTSVPVAFNKAGEVSVICAIHPRMKMSVKVAN